MRQILGAVIVIPYMIFMVGCASSEASGDIKYITTGIRTVRAISHVYQSYPMIDAIIIEYAQEVKIPNAVSVNLYSVADYGTSDLAEPYERRPYSERKISAVYTNNEPRQREDEYSVPGVFVILQLERMENSVIILRKPPAMPVRLEKAMPCRA